MLRLSRNLGYSGATNVGDLPLVFYCHSGMRSAQASAYMTNKGRSNVYNLQGGILAWGKAGYPFEALK